ncbi:hypothetical protein JD844_005807 [Phrynosoma platyrhinos]|uniref:NAD(P)-binding domain-containing protein n=1 Tax=Phrynosoma platyrhinos TaxID=52577 RepID=A0ABQ7TPA4_PHRPL|nr:hypothetical protein JD844_005807 [Phrynosoma platyrhinos]
MHKTPTLSGWEPAGRVRDKDKEEKSAFIRVTVLVRDPIRLPPELQPAQIVVGDVLNLSDVDRAVKGQDAVIVILGTRNDLSPTTMMSEGTRNIVAAMKSHGIRKVVVCLSVPAKLRPVTEDHIRMQQILKESGLDCVYVMPPHIAESIMAPVNTCRTSQQQSGDAVRRSLRRCKRLLRLSDSKISNYRMRKCEDMRLKVLLNNTHGHLQDCAAELRRQRREHSVSQPAPSDAMDHGSPFGEDPQQDMAPYQDWFSPRPPAEDNASSSENPEEEDNIWDVLSWEGLLWDPTSGTPELQEDGYQQALPLDEVLGIDWSGLEPIVTPVPSDGQPTPDCIDQGMEVDPQPAAGHLLDMDSGLFELEHFVDLLISPQ